MARVLQPAGAMNERIFDVQAAGLELCHDTNNEYFVCLNLRMEVALSALTGEIQELLKNKPLPMSATGSGRGYAGLGSNTGWGGGFAPPGEWSNKGGGCAGGMNELGSMDSAPPGLPQPRHAPQQGNLSSMTAPAAAAAAAANLGASGKRVSGSGMPMGRGALIGGGPGGVGGGAGGGGRAQAEVDIALNLGGAPGLSMAGDASPPSARPGDASSGAERGPGAGAGERKPSAAKPSAPFAPPAPTALEAPSVTEVNERLMAAVWANRIDEVDQVMRGGACPARLLPGGGGFLLMAAMQAGAQIDMISQLLKAKCAVNFLSPETNTTPLSHLIQHYSSGYSAVLSCLLAAQADLTMPDGSGASSLDMVQAMVSQQGATAARPELKQLLFEVSEQPTIDFHLHRHASEPASSQLILGASFTDPSMEKVLFCTDSSLYTYSLIHRKPVSSKRLSNQKLRMKVADLCANPRQGTIAILLEREEMQLHYEHMVIVWPSGNMADEEELKIAIARDQNAYPPTVGLLPSEMLCSKTDFPVTLVCRSASGNVIYWRLHHSSAQVDVDQTLMVRDGGAMALSVCGNWIAVAELDGGGAGDEGKVYIWHRKEPEGEGLQREAQAALPQRIAVVNARPHCMAIMPGYGHQGGAAAGRLAVCPTVTASSPSAAGRACIEVFNISEEGAVTQASSIPTHAPVKQLSCCEHDSDQLMAIFEDDVIGLVQVSTGQVLHTYGDPDTRSASTSPDGRLLLCTSGRFFKVLKAPMTTLEG
eukprot:TRINITY_DN44978_c0_g1_i1.p1 TRINITY_DN44978_c0_g1~~TRINITY_DN44978_c0_g1_i1.p1  ORF type:complete len:762 (-),score=179.54 TRINITY_DN44978_c0_g1_i1:180-2465(-)